MWPETGVSRKPRRQRESENEPCAPKKPLTDFNSYAHPVAPVCRHEYIIFYFGKQVF